MILYTKTVCPKCMLVKSEMARLGLELEIKNMDHDEEARQLVLDKGFMAAPILQVGDDWYSDVSEIINQLEKHAQ